MASLPHQLIKFISKRLHLLDYVNFDGVAKSWRSTSKKCTSNRQFPLLELSDHRTASCSDTHQVYSIPELPWYDEWRFRKFPCSSYDWKSEYKVIGSSHGQIIMSHNNSVYFDLFRFPTWTNYIDHLPPLYDHDINRQVDINLVRRIVLSRKPDVKTREKVLVLMGTGSGSKLAPGFMFCIALNGKFYALSLQGTLAVIDIDSDIPEVEMLLGTARRAVPSVSSRCFREFLIESGGEILLIFLISKKSFNKVDDVEVFRLDLTSVSWIKMESLVDQTLFIGLNCCMAISASELGCKANTIYFRQNMIDGWWEFNMGDGTITQRWEANTTIKKFPEWVTSILE
ncbi:Protein of unknown function DUF295 [Macleaya cordata]|uniref:KIB1-4 beta-propeller domain-containing protein n=1 Tax=Macleaya cordata TaxID=56857 RepID=A0A200PT52_MACCD|nr:Protein of unknown function DUF295 [Macleaya cordata]